MPDTSAQPLRPRPLHPLQAYLDNVLLTRAQPWPVTLGAKSGEFHAEHAQFSFTPVATAYFTCADQDLRVEFASLDFIRLHPAVAQVPQEAHLPEDILLAVMELLLTPLLPGLQELMGSAVVLQKISLVPDSGSLPVATLQFCMTINDAESVQPPLALRVLVFNEQTTEILANRLLALPPRQIEQETNELPMAISIEAGSMRVSLDELASLKKNDILLPPSYLGNQGQIRLRVGNNGKTAARTMLCSISEQQVRVIAIETIPEETTMPDTTPPETSAPTPEHATPAPVKNTNLDDLDIELCFELERRLMSVKEIAALTPGYTFSLGCNPLAPVTLRAHGKTLGTGSLVDLNGVLGVQITALYKAGESNDRH